MELVQVVRCHFHPASKCADYEGQGTAHDANSLCYYLQLLRTKQCNPYNAYNAILIMPIGIDLRLDGLKLISTHCLLQRVNL